jgi:hypothetical protein
MRFCFSLFAIAALTCGQASLAPAAPPEGFVSLFDGKTFANWKTPDSTSAQWQIENGVIDVDPAREGKRGDLYTEKRFKNFTLLLDWRIKATPYKNPNVPVILPDGTHKKDENGKEIRMTIPDSDSGVYLRGSSKSQVNIWCWPCGSGEVYGYRMDAKQPPEVRAAVTPKKNADKKVGEWNTMEITLKGDRLWVKLNGEEVIANAQLPGIPEEGPIGLQLHGGYNKEKKEYTGSPSLVQFRNIYIKELP